VIGCCSGRHTEELQICVDPSGKEALVGEGQGKVWMCGIGAENKPTSGGN